MNYWMKEIADGDSWLPDGRKIQVDFVDSNNNGWIGTEVAYVNRQIAMAVNQGIGGWVPATKDQYDDALKKKGTRQVQESTHGLYRASQPLNQTRNAAGAVVASSIEVPVPPKPDPIRVPTPEQMKPRKGPIPKEALL